MSAPSFCFSGAVAATCTALLASAWLAQRGDPPTIVASALAVATIAHAFVVLSPDRIDERRGVLVGTALALAIGVAMLVPPLVLSDDLHRYAWDGRVSLAGIDPYRHAPDDAALHALRDASPLPVNHAELPTIYPPIAQLIFALAQLSGTLVAHRLLALLALLGCIPLAARLADPDDRGRVAIAVGIAPLALAESALSGHVDVFVGLFVLAFALARDRGREGAAAGWVALATGTKLAGLVLAPLLRGRARTIAIVCSLALAAPLFFAGYGGRTASGLAHYATHWRGSSPGFAAIEQLVATPIEAWGRVQGATHGHVRLPLREVLVWLEGTPLDPRAALVSEKKPAADPGDLQVAIVAGVLARGIAFALVLAVAFASRRLDARTATRRTLLALLLVAPQVHPWYVLWLLPLEIAAGGLAGLVLAACVLSSYAVLDGWQRARIGVAEPLVAFAYAPVVMALAWEVARTRRWAGWRLHERPAKLYACFRVESVESADTHSGPRNEGAELEAEGQR